MAGPTPPPIAAGTKWYQSAAFWSWLLTTAVSIAGGIATLLGHPFDSATVTSVATGVAWTVAGITTTVFVHGQQKLLMQERQHAHEVRLAYLPRGGQ